MFIAKEKKEELDALLSRAQAALENLQKIFFTYTGKISITYRYLRDIISVYKRCQDLEKILKSHFFEDEELTKVHEEIRDLMYDEKRNELNDRLVKIYERRKGGGSNESPYKESPQSSPLHALEDTTGYVFPEVENPNSPKTGLTQLASAIVNSVMKTVSVAQLQNQEYEMQESTILQNGYAENLDLGATAAADIPKVNDTDMKFDNTGKSKGEPDIWQAPEENVSVPCETKGLNVSQESGLEVSDCDSGLGESKGSGASLERNTLASTQRKKEEVCRRFCHLMLSQMVKIRHEIDNRWKNTKAWMTDGSDKCEQDTQTDIQGQGERTGVSPCARLVEELMVSFNSEFNDGGLCETNGVESIEDTPEMSDLKQDVETYKQALCATQGFVMCEAAPSTHNFASKMYSPHDPKSFLKAVRKEYKLLQNNLPNGILVKGFEDRMDLFSVMILGPQGTPYEDGLFFFDVFLPPDYPTSPPVFHYISYCTDRLNPNLYEDGKVCVSLLGTWDGKGSEMWTSNSNMLQVLVSIQGLILVPEPYYNEAGFEKQRGSVIGEENSKMYNEMAIIKLVQSMTRMIENPPHSFKEEMTSHLKLNAARMIQRFQFWMEMGSGHGKQDRGVGLNCDSSWTAGLSRDQAMDISAAGHMVQQDSLPKNNTISNTFNFKLPEFPLFPPSKGFCLPMKKYWETFKQTVKRNILTPDENVNNPTV